MYKGMQLTSLQLIGFNMISLVIPECGRLPKSLQVIMCEATGTWRQDSVASANLTHWILYRPAHARVGHGGWLNEPRRALGLVEDHHGQRPRRKFDVMAIAVFAALVTNRSRMLRAVAKISNTPGGPGGRRSSSRSSSRRPRWLGSSRFQILSGREVGSRKLLAWFTVTPWI